MTMRNHLLLIDLLRIHEFTIFAVDFIKKMVDIFGKIKYDIN